MTIKRLRELILEMAGLVEQSLMFSLDKEKDLPFHYEIEQRINQYHLLIDDSCFKFIALKAPHAKDLRTVIAMMKINSDLERMGDQSLKIKRHSLELAGDNPQLKSMLTEVGLMVKNAIESFVNSNTKMSTDVISHDQIINNMNRDIIKNHIGRIKNNEIHFDYGYGVIKISKNLERIGDHAKNIAEDVIFLESGSDIRHSTDKIK